MLVGVPDKNYGDHNFSAYEFLLLFKEKEKYDGQRIAFYGAQFAF